MIKNIKKHMEKEKWILLCFILLYIGYFIYFTFEKHQLFLTGRYDLGNMDQTVWNTVHGRIFSFTNPDFDKTMSRLSVHADFILVLLAPFYLIWSNAQTLLFIQTVVIAFGALFVYLIGKKVLSQKFLPLLLSISYLLNPYVERQNIFDFHSVSLVTTFLLGAFYFMENNNSISFLLCIILAVLTKEHIFLIAAFFGLYLFFFKKKKWGLLLSLFSFIFFYLLIAVFIPQARVQDHFALAYYKDLGSSPIQIILTVLTNPVKIGQIFIKNDISSYMSFLFMPVGYLSILSPGYFFFALPEFLINVLSSDGAFRSFYYHYAAASLPFIYISSIYGVKKIVKKFPSRKIFFFLCAYILGFALLSAWIFGPLPGGKKADLSIFKTTVNAQTIHTYLNTIPGKTALSATNNIAAQLVHRKKIYSLPNGITRSNYVLFLVTNINDSTDMNVQYIRQLMKNSDFHIDYQLDNFISFKRNKTL